MINTHSKPLRLAIVGLGRVALKHIKAVKHLGDTYEIIALIDTSENRFHELNRELELNLKPNNYFTSLNAMYSAGMKPDVVAIATPSGTHYSLAMLALEHGSHLMVEKPLTLDLLEAEELVNTATSKNLKIAVGHIYRFFPIVNKLRAEIADGKWGEVYAADVKVRWGHDQAYYDQADWRGSWAQDGGALMNQTVHALDLMTWLLSSKPVQIQGNIKQISHKMEAEDYGAAILTMEEGYICQIEGTTNTPQDYQSASFYISTEKGEIVAGLKNKKPYLEIVDRSGKKLGSKYIRSFIGGLFRDGVRQSINEFTNPHSGIFKDLATAIHEDREPRANGLDGLLSVEYILAIYKSAKEGGKAVELPLDRNFSLQDMVGFFD